MQIKKFNDVVAPSVRKIQVKMAEVVEHFKHQGYIPSNSKLERIPDADCFEVVGKNASKPEGPYDITTFRAKYGSKQELSSFKQHEADETFAMTRDDFNDKGQRIRHIYDLGSEYGEKGLTEYEYEGQNLIKETNVSTVDGFTSKSVKTIDAQTGNYTTELIHPDINYDLIGRDYKQYNSKHQKIMEFHVSNRLNGVTTMKTKFDPETGMPTAIINEQVSNSGVKVISQCDIDKVGNLTKFEKTCDGKTMEMFEKNKYGEITHYIDNYGNEYKYDSATNKSILTYKNGDTTTSCSQGTAKEFVEGLIYDIPYNMRKFL
jgi:hypothetical protein